MSALGQKRTSADERKTARVAVFPCDLTTSLPDVLGCFSHSLIDSFFHAQGVRALGRREIVEALEMRFKEWSCCSRCPKLLRQEFSARIAHSWESGSIFSSGSMRRLKMK